MKSNSNYNPTLKWFITKYRKMSLIEQAYLKELLDHSLYFDWDKIPFTIIQMINKGILKTKLLSDHWTIQIDINVD